MKKRNKLLFFLSISAGFIGTGRAQQAPGTIAPNAKVIVHANKFFPFHEGLAVLRNDNSSYAVINAAGDIVVPYNKFRIKDNEDDTGFRNGMCLITDASRKVGVINKEGKVVFPVQFSYVTNFFEEGFAYAQRYLVDESLILRKDGSAIIIKDKDANGKKIFNVDRGGRDESGWGNGLVVVSRKTDGPPQEGYMNSAARIVIPTVYIWARPFSEGLAAVAKKDDFGELKWGFINTAGKVVIPFQFSNEPAPFSGGLSLIKPLDIPEYKFGYIDKNGAVIIKIKEGNGPGWSGGSFQGNYAIWDEPNGTYPETRGVLVMDKTGKTTRLNDYGLKSEFHDLSYRTTRKKDMLFFTGAGNKSREFGVGLISPTGVIIFPPVFSHLTEFDPVSNLAYAEFGRGENRIKGYIDRSGVFVIVQGKKTGF